MNGLTAVAVVLAVTAAGCFAAAAVLQHDAVRRHGTARAWRTRRWWSGGIAATAGAAGHATALALAPLAVVQPLGVLAVPLGVLFERRSRLRSNDRARPDGVGSSGTDGITAVAWAVVGVVGGVGLFTLATTTAADVARPPADGWRVLTVIALVGLPALLLLSAALVRGRPAGGTPWSPFRSRGGHRWTFPHRNGDRPAPAALSPGTVRCLAHAVPAAVAFGLVSAVLRAGIEIAARGPDASLVWLGAVGLFALVAGGLGVQSAFRNGPASVVVACLTVVDPLAAVGVGALALDERIATGPAGVLAAAAGALMAVSGVLLLARHHPDATGPRPYPPPSHPYRADPAEDRRRP